MRDIRILLKIARIRLELSEFFGRIHQVAIVIAAIALMLALADRAPAEAFVPWSWIGPVLAVICAAVAAVLWLRRRPSELQVAIAVDDRLDLKEKLSTALHCRERSDVFSSAAMEDAVTAARDPRSREAVRRKFRVAAPPRWWISPVIIAAVVGVLFAPQADLFAKEDPVVVAERNDAQKQAEQSIEVVAKSIEDKPLLKTELESLMEELAQESKDPTQLDKPEDIKRDALREMTKLNNALDDIINGEKGKTAQALEDKLSQLKAMEEDGLSKELADALAEGDFKSAKAALEKIAEQAASGEMTQEQKDAAAEQLANIGEQLEQLAQQQKALEDALRQAGMNPQLANNPQALQQAIQQNQNLNQQQKQQLQQMQQAQQQACQQCQGLGQACQQMAQAMQNGQNGQCQQGAQQAGQQLNQMEQMQQLLQQAQAAANQCQGACQGLGQGMGQQWKQGGGMGGPGQGSGGKAPISPTPYGTKLTKADAPVGEGEIIASMLISGTPIRGEVKSQLKKVTQQQSEGTDEALNEDDLPRRYHEAQKHYFGELEKQVEAAPTSDEQESESGGDASGEADDGGKQTDPPAEDD
jgi:hypothetical protein